MAGKNTLAVLALAAIGSLGLRAAEPTGPWYVGADLNVSNASISGDTPGAKGFSLRAGRTFWTGFAGTGYRITAEVGRLADTSQLTNRDIKYTQLQLGGELIVNTPVQDLKFILGVNVNKWRISSDYDAYEAFHRDEHNNPVDDGPRPAGNTSHAIAGLKLGGKLGFEYFVTRNWSARLVYQVAEAGTSSEHVTADNPLWTNGLTWTGTGWNDRATVGRHPDQGKFAMTPGWIQLGVSYHF